MEQREDELVATGVVGMKRIFCVTLYSHDTCLWFNLARIIEYGCIQGTILMYYSEPPLICTLVFPTKRTY